MDYKAALIELNKRCIEIVTQKCHDAQSGWDGCHYYLKNKEGFMNSDGTTSRSTNTRTLDFSINGYCFKESNVEYVMKQVAKFYEFQDVKDFDSFKQYIDSHAKSLDE